MQIKPQIAVIITCYNLGRTLGEAIDSVLVQTRPTAEILVVDDGSTDIFTRQILQRLDRPKTRVVTINHQGVAKARNYGVSRTVAPYIIFLDADDLLAPAYLEILGECLDTNPSISFVSSGVQAFESASYKWCPPSTTAVGTLTRGSVHISTMFRRSLWDTVSGFDEKLEGYEDLDFWLRAIESGFKGEVINEPLLLYRVRNVSRYANSLEPDAYRRIMRRIIEGHLPLIETYSLDILYEKENFITDILEYRDNLMLKRKNAHGQLKKLDDEIKSLTEELESRLGSSYITTNIINACNYSTIKTWQSELQIFLEHWRWLIRGSIAIISNIDSFAETVSVPRWDTYNTKLKEKRLPVQQLYSIPHSSQDCIITVLSSPPEEINDVISSLMYRLKPGGSLLITLPALQRWKTDESLNNIHPSDIWLRGILSGLFPLDAFDIEIYETLASAVCRVDQVNRLPFSRRSSQTKHLPSGKGIVLLYHRIAELETDTYGLCVSPHNFRQHMRYLKENFTVMSLFELFFAARGGVLPPRAVAITFDDGYLDALTNAAPILASEGMYGTFFINTEQIHEPHFAWNDEIEHILMHGITRQNIKLQLPDEFIHFDLSTPEKRIDSVKTLIAKLWNKPEKDRQNVLQQIKNIIEGPIQYQDSRRLMVAEEIRALARTKGCEIGSHSENHIVLTEFDEGVQRTELANSKQLLEEILDQPIVSFAYPYGEYSKKLSQLVYETPYLLAVSVESGTVDSNIDPMLIPRIEIKNCDAAFFADKIESFFKDGQHYKQKNIFITIDNNCEKRNNDPDLNEADHLKEINDILSLNEYSNGVFSLKSMPQFLVIDPTSRCNARCIMCPLSFKNPSDSGTDLDPVILEKLMQLLPTAAHVNLFSTGEPTIAKNIEELLDLVKVKTNNTAFICMSTNGRHIPDGVMKRIMAPRMGLQFSIDGGTKEVFESIRRGIKFEEICHSLDMANRARGGNPYPLFSFSSTISKRNLHDLIHIFELAAKYGINHVYFYEEDPEVAEEEAFILDPTDRATFEAQLKHINDTGVPYSNGLYFRGQKGLLSVNPPPEDRASLRCSAPWKVFHQRADGTVRTCCTLRQAMGNMKYQTFDEVWNGKAYTNLRRAFIEQSGIPNTCYRCTDPLRTYGA